jgi:type I restriction enzyme, S subunit
MGKNRRERFIFMRFDWKENRLGDVANVTTGQSAPQGSGLFGNEGHPFVRAGSLDPLCNGGQSSQLEHLTDDVASQYRMRLFPADTILFAKSGMSAKKGLVYRLNVPSYVVSHLAAVLPSGKVIPEFLEHWLRTNPPNRLISNEAYPSIRTSQINDMRIRYPANTNEQKRIAAILNKADDIRRKRAETIRLADDFLKSTFLDMFGAPVTNPKGWSVRRLGDLLSFLTSGSRGWAKYYSETGAKFLRIQNVGQNRLLEADMAHVDAPASAESRRTAVRHGDVLLSITADLGRTAVVPKDFGSGHINQHLCILRPRTQDVAPCYLSQFLSSEGGQRQIDSKNRSAVKAGLNFDDIRSLEVVLPPLDRQTVFARFHVRWKRWVDKQSVGFSGEASELFDALSQKAFQGEL